MTQYYQESTSKALNIDSVPPGTNHCYPILTQYTASSSRMAQLSKVDLVFIFIQCYYFCKEKEIAFKFSLCPKERHLKTKSWSSRRLPVCTGQMRQGLHSHTGDVVFMKIYVIVETCNLHIYAMRIYDNFYQRRLWIKYM